MLLRCRKDPAKATLRVAAIAERFLSYDEMRCAVRLNEGDRVVLFDPGERRRPPARSGRGTALAQGGAQPRAPAAGAAHADIIASHLELRRRAALLPLPFRPGWKREPKR